MNDINRIALISDIHGNTPALRAILSDIKNSSVNSVVFLGDLATLGPAPTETIKMIQDLGCPCIMGNHEEALFEPQRTGDFNIKEPLLQEAIYWCLSKLSTEDMAFLKSFHKTLHIPLSLKESMLCYHGSPKSTIEAILPDTLDNKLDQLFTFDKSIKVAVGGHTHFQMLQKYKETLIINPGSVGMAFRNPSLSMQSPTLLPVAEYAILEVNKGNISVELKSIRYNLIELKALIQNSDMPLKDWWLGEIERME